MAENKEEDAADFQVYIFPEKLKDFTKEQKKKYAEMLAISAISKAMKSNPYLLKSLKNKNK